MCFYHGCDSPSFFDQRERTARKARRCDECGLPIHKGERYRHTAGKWEGEFSTYSQCERCLTLLAAIDAVETADGCTGAETQPGFGALFEQVEDWGHYADEFLRLGRLDALVLVPCPGPREVFEALEVDGDYWANDYEDGEPAEWFDLGGEA